MRNTLVVIWHYIRAFLLIYACLYAGNIVAVRLPVTIPGSIIGMLILFLLLSLNILPNQWVKPACHMLIRYMALLFVPIGVGIMQYKSLLIAQFGPIVVSCTISTLLVLVTVGLVSHRIHGERRVIGDDEGNHK